MTQTLHIKENEAGAVRVFALSMDAFEVQPYLEVNTKVSELLGIDLIDPQYVEVFPISDLEGLGLVGYLTEGQGIAEDALAPDRSRLNALDGHVMIVMSAAFAGREHDLTLDPRLTLIGEYPEDTPPVVFESLPQESSQGVLTGVDPDPVAPRKKFPTLLAIFLIALLIALALWLAA